MTDAPQVTSLSELRQYVRQALCRHENLVEDQFALLEQPLSRGGKPCGIQFTLRGPRQVRLGAVWAADRNDVYLYDARGERFAKVRLAADLVQATA